MLSYAGVNLLLQDPQGETNRFLRRFLDERMASIFSETPIAVNEGRQNARLNNNQSSIAQVGLPVPNYPMPPTPRINTLYWPTGASRYAYGLFLINGAQLTQILTAVGNQNTPRPLIMGTPDAKTTYPAMSSVSTSMYLLPARPVSPPNVPANDRLWILPLVDDRYFWQFRSVSIINDGRVGSPSPSFSPVTWDDCFIGLATSLASSLTVDTITSDFGFPDFVEWKRDGENAAMLLDAAAQTVGQRVVRDWSTGNTYTLGYSSSISRYNANTANIVPGSGGWQIVAGGDFSSVSAGSILPSAVQVTFRSDDASKISGYGSVSVSGSIYEPTTVKTFHSTMPYSSPAASGLATAIADAYGGYLARRYDYDFDGIVPWTPTGYDDFVLWEYGVTKANKLVCQTRVQTLPYNFGITNLPVSTPSSSSGSGSIGIGSSSSSSGSTSSSGSASSSGSSGSSGPGSGSGSSNNNNNNNNNDCGCITVVTGISCVDGDLVVTTGSAKKCC